MPQRVVQDPGPDKFRLSSSERSSQFWIKVSRELEKLLESARKRNDDTMNDQDTQRLRGKISAYKEILEFGKDDVEPLEWSGGEIGTGGIVQPRAR